MSNTTHDIAAVERFIRRWAASSAAERAHKDQFFLEFCAVLGVDAPNPDRDKHDDYRFEKPVVIAHEDGRSTTQFIDFYKRGHFVIEAKQGSESADTAVGTARRGTAAWDKAMRGAFGKSLKYASYLPEGKPPFLITWSADDVAAAFVHTRRASVEAHLRTLEDLVVLVSHEDDSDRVRWGFLDKPNT